MTLTSAMSGLTLWRRLTRPARIVHAAAGWEKFAGKGWESRVMAVDVRDRFHAKQGRSIGRWTLTRDTGASLVVYLKRHHVLPRAHGLLAAVFPGRAWSPGLAEWDHLAWADAQGFPVPRAVAAGEFRGPWGKLQSFLAVEELTGMLPLHEAIPLAQSRLSPDEFAAWKRGLIGELARLTRELHRRGAFHNDLYLCHFYVATSDIAVSPKAWPGRLVMIDFHRLGRPRVGRAWFRVKDLAQLMYSCDGVAGVTARDRLRFWKLYRGTAADWGGRHPPRFWVAAAVRWKWRLYARHAARRLARTRSRNG